eukprot:NODE_315_length_11202_cov_0.258849.p8 type:complete len:135 gc:universal NODE_315_length_11202_cov_0.258849:309-713(+)
MSQMLNSKLHVLVNLTKTNIFHYVKEPKIEFLRFKYMMKYPPHAFRRDHWREVAVVEGPVRPLFEPVLIKFPSDKTKLLNELHDLNPIQRYLKELNNCCGEGTKIRWKMKEYCPELAAQEWNEENITLLTETLD